VFNVSPAAAAGELVVRPLASLALNGSSIQFPGLNIVAELGRGETGIVYRAVDLRFGREVALKVLLPDSATEWNTRVSRFLREARAMASLMGDPNIPAVYEVGEVHGQPYLTRELVEGVTFDDAVRAGSIKLSQGVCVVGALAGAVARIHRRGLVHRNMHPTNVLIARDGVPKLIGFGRVKCLDIQTTSTTQAVLLEIDARALQAILDWLFKSLEHSWPTNLESICPPNSAPTAKALETLLARPTKRWWAFWK